MKRHGLQDQRGSVLLFTTLLLALLIGMGGLAIDLSYLAAAKGEVQRSMDAAALAGAGNLGFNASVFPTVRQEAWRFGDLNPYRVGTVNLSLNSANAANGDIVIGIWDPNTNSFTPSLNGTQVNSPHPVRASGSARECIALYDLALGPPHRDGRARHRPELSGRCQG